MRLKEFDDVKQNLNYGYRDVVFWIPTKFNSSSSNCKLLETDVNMNREMCQEIVVMVVVVAAFQLIQLITAQSDYNEIVQFWKKTKK